MKLLATKKARLISLEFVDTVFEDNFAAFVDETVADACKCKNSANDRAHVDQELKEIFSRVCIHHSEGRHLIVENNQAFIGLELSFAGTIELKHFVAVHHFGAAENSQEPRSELAVE